MEKYIFDMECDAIKATKIHCLSYCNVKDGKIVSIHLYEDIIRFFKQNAVFIGHNIIKFDIPIIQKILGISVIGQKVDTLTLSWYLSSERARHGLGAYGEEFGIEKPDIQDWENLEVSQYIHRCEEDVKINLVLWKRQYSYLRELYEGNEDAINGLINYLSFKMECAAEQEILGIKLNVVHCHQKLLELQGLREIKMEELKRVMPKVPVIVKRMAPKVILRKDGSLSSHGEAWRALLAERGLPANYEEQVDVIRGEEEPNPGSHDQLKKWLYSLGWVPEHIKHVRDKKKGTTKKIPQIAAQEGGGEICPSIKKLYEKEPKLELLGGLSVLSHRVGILKAFLEDQQEGVLFPTAMGLTNTLRMQHSVIVNLPGLDKKYGEDIRACLIPFEGCTLLGSDLQNIEDKTKRHYIHKYDPTYVEEMNIEGFDAHLDIGILAGIITEEESDFFKQYEKDKEGDKRKYEDIRARRYKSKVTNFSATYKIGAEALARNSGLKLSEAKRVLLVYWQRNKAILDIERDCTVIEIGSKKWLLNPISKFWYQLRADKDRFSTLNQGTAAYVFDLWLSYIRKLGLRINFQYHDEFVANVRIEQQQWAQDVVSEAIRLINEKLQLNVQIGCSIHFGDKYSAIH